MRPKGAAQTRGLGRQMEAVLEAAGRALRVEEIAAELAAQGVAAERTRLIGAVREDFAICRTAVSTYDLTFRRLRRLRLRHLLTAAEIRHGVLIANPDLLACLDARSNDWGRRALQVVDRGGARLPVDAKVVATPRRTPSSSPFAADLPVRIVRLHLLAGLGGWYESEGAGAGDEVVFTFVDPAAASCAIELRSSAESAADTALLQLMQRLLRQAHGSLDSRQLLRRIVGAWDMGQESAPRLPIFCLPADGSIDFDGIWYQLADRGAGVPATAPDDGLADPGALLGEYIATMAGPELAARFGQLISSRLREQITETFASELRLTADLLAARPELLPRW